MLDPPDFSLFTIAEVLEAIPQIAFVYRADGILVAANRVCEEATGVPRELAIGRFNMFDNAAALDPLLLAAYHRAFRGEPQLVPATEIRLAESNSLDLPFRDDVRWAENTLIPIGRTADGGAAYVLGLSRDVTEAVLDRQERDAARARIDVQQETIASLEAARREIEAQKATIEALSTPVIEVWDGIVTLPLLGYFDVARADAMTAQLLEAVVRVRAHHVILDLTGMSTIDAAAADNILRAVRSVALLGAVGVLVGIRPDLARSLIDAGVDLGKVRTHQNLRQALKACISERSG